jgi:adenylate cyclase
MHHNNSNSTDQVPTLQPLPNEKIAMQSEESQATTVLERELLMPKEQRVILICDVVESVRWMEHDEDNAISRWSHFAAQVREQLALVHEGRVVKSTGDGLMIEFKQAPQAVAAAHALHSLAQEGNQRLAAQDPERQLHLRIGIHQAEVRRDAHDLYGHGVNLAARITTLAGPGEIIVTPEVRDHITDSLDGQIEDMGECYLKHLQEPQRVYRVGVAGHEPLLVEKKDFDYSIKPTIAVIPFSLRIGSKEHVAYGDLIADGVISRLVRSNSMRVLSRFSTASLRGTEINHSSLTQLLGANYVLRGDFSLIDSKIMIGYELTNTQNHEVIVSDRVQASHLDLFEQSSEICTEIAYKSINSIIDEQLQLSLTRPMPTLASYSLFLMGVGGIHRSMPQKNEAGEAALRHIMERHPRSAEPAIWLAQWLAIKANRGLSSDASINKKTARHLLEKALSIEPSNSFGLSVSGLVNAFYDQKFDDAHEKYERALIANPNDYMAHLYKSTMFAWTDRGLLAIQSADIALNLSPLHPMRYYIESLASLAYLVGGDFAEAQRLSQSAIKMNRTHTASYRTLAASLVLQGKLLEAKDAVNKLKLLEPQTTLSQFIERYPGRDSSFSRIYQNCLLKAGFHN